ncbi:MAG: FAD-dependent oxidoreductase [Erythrobacter sp.]|uniref:FAD-dependent oxidoreductase n=1 Tax=Erythrobacter sp. TaxID=1042 RepID=UPI002621F7BD|nr:FAD-dependent oxidoreductase [Erythrobacter sp.]MDJ0978163.1 FAD-dependent oxidoreductase [Erythrobacter sp.]
MPQDRIIIVGAGLLGVCSAWELAERGYAVTVLEARPGAGEDTSFANGGMLTPSMPDPWNSPGVWKHLASSLFDPTSAMKLRLRAVPSLMSWGISFLRHSSPRHHQYATEANLRLALLSVPRTLEWADRLGLEFDRSDKGSLKFFLDRDEFEQAVSKIAWLRDVGLGFEALDATATIAREPALASIEGRLGGAIHYPGDARGDAHLFTKGLAAAARQAGVEFRYDTQVESLLVERGRVAGVQLRGGRAPADQVIVAAANASRGLIGPLGLRLPVRPAKGYSVTFDVEGIDGVPGHALIDDARHAALVPLGTCLRAVGTAEFTGEDRRMRPERIDNLKAMMRANLPSVAAALEGQDGNEWCGLRPMSADGRPFIGATRIPGLWLNTGHGSLGWTLAAGSAKLLGELISKDTPSVDPEPYAASRI